MKLAELNPKELNSGYIQFDCPAGHPHRVVVPTDKQFHPKAWDRTGEFPDTLTLSPSIRVHNGSPHRESFANSDEYERAAKCGWHGFITKGEVTNA